MKPCEQVTGKFCCSCLRPLILMVADVTAIVVICFALNLFFLLAIDTKLISWPVVVRGGLFFIFTAEFSHLYHESILAPPGLIPPPQEELRRIFLIFFGLLTVRMFYFREFPLLAKHFGDGDPVSVPLKFLLAFGMLPFLCGGVILFRWLAREWMIRKEIGVMPVVILGAGTTGGVVARVLKKSKHFGLKPVGFFDDDPRKQVDRSTGCRSWAPWPIIMTTRSPFPG
jgi:FlaA1/EpsC-like NDP-sugar epimerase